MRQGFIVMAALILLVPFVSAFSFGDINIGNIFNSGKVFVADNWDPKIWAVIVAVAFIVIIAGIGKHKANEAMRAREAAGIGGALALGAGALGAKAAWWGGKKLAGGAWGLTKLPFRGAAGAYRWNRARKDRKLQEAQLEVDMKIDKRLSGLTRLGELINQEEKRLDQRAYKLEEMQKRLEYWQKRAHPYLMGVLERIKQVNEEIKKREGKMMNPSAARESLQRLQQQFDSINSKHIVLLDRFKSLMEAEKQVITAKAQRQAQAEDADKQKLASESGEVDNLTMQAREAGDELRSYKKANASPRDIEVQRQKLRDIMQRRKTLIKEIKRTEEAEKIDKEARAIEAELLDILDKQERLIDGVARTERMFEQSTSTIIIPPEVKFNAESRLGEGNKEIGRNSIRIRGLIDRLRKIDRIDDKVVKRAESLEGKRKRTSNDEAERIVELRDAA